ncbi:MAG: hypothetical protein ACI3XQ_11355 [Eubacteriales bacterium]
MDPEEVIRKYCNTCINRKDCWSPCLTAIAALYTVIETVEQLERSIENEREKNDG